MRPLMVVIPHKLLQVGDAQLRAAWIAHQKAFFIQGAEEALHFPVRLRMARLGQPMRNPKTFAGLLKAGLPFGIIGVAHRKDQVVVGHDRLNAVRQSPYHFFQEGNRIGARALGADARHCFAAEVVHRCISVFSRAVYPPIEIFQIQVQQLPRTTLLIATPLAPVPDSGSTNARALPCECRSPRSTLSRTTPGYETSSTVLALPSNKPLLA